MCCARPRHVAQGRLSAAPTITRAFTYPTLADPTTVAGSTYGSLFTTAVADGAGLETLRSAVWSGGSWTRTVIGRDDAKRETTVTLGSLTFSRRFDGAGRIDNQWGSGLLGSADATTYAYGTTGKKTSEALVPSFGPAIGSTFSYTDGGRLATVTAAGAGTYAYDKAGNITTATAGATTTVLSYDANRLTNRKVAGSVVETYTWDTEHGYRTRQGPTANPAATVFGYSPTGRLTSYATSAGVNAAYTYDAGGQRTRSVVCSGGTTTTTEWTYEGLTLLSVRAASTGSTTASWTIDYLYDGSGRPYAGVYRSGAEAAASFTFVTTDRGDVVGLLDKSGVGFVAYRYDAWGRSTSTTSQGTARIGTSAASRIAIRQPLRYAGYCYDEESGLYYLSARHYDPVSMQFLTKDPAKADGEESAYQYCGGDPVGKVDPSGLAMVECHDAGGWWGPWWVTGCKLLSIKPIMQQVWVLGSVAHRLRGPLMSAAVAGAGVWETGPYGAAAVAFGTFCTSLYRSEPSLLSRPLQVKWRVTIKWRHAMRRHFYRGSRVAWSERTSSRSGKSTYSVWTDFTYREFRTGGEYSRSYWRASDEAIRAHNRGHASESRNR